MAKASRIAARTARTLDVLSDQIEALEKRLITLEVMMEVMLSKTQRAQLEKLLAMRQAPDDEAETEAPDEEVDAPPDEADAEAPDETEDEPDGQPEEA